MLCPPPPVSQPAAHCLAHSVALLAVALALADPSGVDVTLQQGDHWFYTPGDPLNSLSTLVGFYHDSVGANGHLEIDFGIDRTGGVDPKHAAGYKGFGDWIQSCYGSPVAEGLLASGATSLVAGAWVPFSQGTTVGAKRIDVADSAVTATALRWTATAGFGTPTGLKLFAFAPGPCALAGFEYPTSW